MVVFRLNRAFKGFEGVLPSFYWVSRSGRSECGVAVLSMKKVQRKRMRPTWNETNGATLNERRNVGAAFRFFSSFLSSSSFFFGVPLLFVFSSFAREKKGNEKGSEESSPIGPPWVARFGPSWCASFFFPIHQPSAFPRGLLGFSYRVFHGFTGYCDVATETASRWGGSDASPWFTGHLSDSAWLAMRDRSHLNQLALQWKKKEFDSNGNQQIMGP